jgi:hypothetical protein
MSAIGFLTCLKSAYVCVANYAMQIEKVAVSFVKTDVLEKFESFYSPRHLYNFDLNLADLKVTCDILLTGGKMTPLKKDTTSLHKNVFKYKHSLNF